MLEVIEDELDEGIDDVDDVDVDGTADGTAEGAFFAEDGNLAISNCDGSSSLHSYSHQEVGAEYEDGFRRTRKDGPMRFASRMSVSNALLVAPKTWEKVLP